jgi:methanogenic corrinoid protein MtbC1
VPDDREFNRRVTAASLSERFGLALAEGDAVTAELVVRAAYHEEMPYALIHESIVTPALHRIGLLWERGEISVAREHLATQISLRVLALLRELFGVARRRSELRVMLAGVEGEQHIVALQMAGDLLEDAGYEVVMLGPDVPIGVLAEIVEEVHPAIVALSMTMAAGAAKLPRALDAVSAADQSAGIIVGGRAARLYPRAGAGVTITPTVVDVVEVADALVHRPHLN